MVRSRWVKKEARVKNGTHSEFVWSVLNRKIKNGNRFREASFIFPISSV